TVNWRGRKTPPILWAVSHPGTPDMTFEELKDLIGKLSSDEFQRLLEWVRQHAGLLSPERLEQWLREQLKEQHVSELFDAMDRMAGVDEPHGMSPDEVAREIELMRCERRAVQKP